MSSKGIDFERLALLHAVVDGLPPHKVDMQHISKNNKVEPCGAICCAIGWAALHPAFEHISLDQDGYLVAFGQTQSFMSAAKLQFGVTHSQAINIFGLRGDSHYDSESYAPPRGHGKALFKHRVRQFFIEHGQPVSEQS